jgi:hypothetical protein
MPFVQEIAAGPSRTDESSPRQQSRRQGLTSDGTAEVDSEETLSEETLSEETRIDFDTLQPFDLPLSSCIADLDTRLFGDQAQVNKWDESVVPSGKGKSLVECPLTGVEQSNLLTEQEVYARTYQKPSAWNAAHTAQESKKNQSSAQSYSLVADGGQVQEDEKVTPAPSGAAVVPPTSAEQPNVENLTPPSLDTQRPRATTNPALSVEELHARCTTIENSIKDALSNNDDSDLSLSLQNSTTSDFAPVESVARPYLRTVDILAGPVPEVSAAPSDNAIPQGTPRVANSTPTVHFAQNHTPTPAEIPTQPGLMFRPGEQNPHHFVPAQGTVQGQVNPHRFAATPGPGVGRNPFRRPTSGNLMVGVQYSRYPVFRYRPVETLPVAVNSDNSAARGTVRGSFRGAAEGDVTSGGQHAQSRVPAQNPVPTTLVYRNTTAERHSSRHIDRAAGTSAGSETGRRDAPQTVPGKRHVQDPVVADDRKARRARRKANIRARERDIPPASETDVIPTQDTTPAAQQNVPPSREYPHPHENIPHPGTEFQAPVQHVAQGDLNDVPAHVTASASPLAAHENVLPQPQYALSNEHIHNAGTVFQAVVQYPGRDNPNDVIAAASLLAVQQNDLLPERYPLPNENIPNPGTAFQAPVQYPVQDNPNGYPVACGGQGGQYHLGPRQAAQPAEFNPVDTWNPDAYPNVPYTRPDEHFDYSQQQLVTIDNFGPTYLDTQMEVEDTDLGTAQVDNNVAARNELYSPQGDNVRYCPFPHIIMNVGFAVTAPDIPATQRAPSSGNSDPLFPDKSEKSYTVTPEDISPPIKIYPTVAQYPFWTQDKIYPAAAKQSREFISNDGTSYATAFHPINAPSTSLGESTPPPAKRYRAILPASTERPRMAPSTDEATLKALRRRDSNCRAARKSRHKRKIELFELKVNSPMTIDKAKIRGELEKLKAEWAMLYDRVVPNGRGRVSSRGIEMVPLTTVAGADLPPDSDN